MKRILKGLLVTALIVSAAQIQAHTNKTFLSPRPQGVNLAMEYTTFNELIHRKDPEKFGGNFQVTGFYQASTDSTGLGRYFGINNKNNVTLKYDDSNGGNRPTPACTPSTVICDLDLGYILHEALGNELNGKSVVVKINPEQRVWGARFDYYQDLEKILKGLYLSIALPIVHVENDMNLSIGGCQPCSPSSTDQTLEGRVRNYFKGCTDVSFDGVNAGNKKANNTQAILTKARINGKHSSTGVADIDIKLGYNVLNKENYKVGLNLGVTFPTGNEAKGDFVFEPIHGNGQHWGLGFGCDSFFRFWHDENSSFNLAVMFNYRYLFEDTERRTLGLNKTVGTTSSNTCSTSCGGSSGCGDARNWGQYYLLGDNSNTAASGTPKPLIPAANLTTLSVDVTPGSQFDGIIALAYNHGGLSCDLGYNLYLRERERVSLKGGNNCNAACSTAFEDNRYGIASRGFDTNRTGIPADGNPTFNNPSGAFDNFAGTDTAAVQTANDGDFDGCKEALLKACDLNTCVAETPSQNSHKIFAGLGYIFKEWDNPLMLGSGGSYEWANGAALDGWAIWLKLGVGF